MNLQKYDKRKPNYKIIFSIIISIFVLITAYYYIIYIDTNPNDQIIIEQNSNSSIDLNLTPNMTNTTDEIKNIDYNNKFNRNSNSSINLNKNYNITNNTDKTHNNISKKERIPHYKNINTSINNERKILDKKINYYLYKDDDKNNKIKSNKYTNKNKTSLQVLNNKKYESLHLKINITGEYNEFKYHTAKIKEVSKNNNYTINLNKETEQKCEFNNNEYIINYNEQKTNTDVKINTEKQTHCINEYGIEGNTKLSDFIKDTTGDGLSDYRQQKLGLNYTTTDTTNDGFSDKEGLKRNDIDVNRKNVLVEITRMDGINTKPITYTTITELFDEAPIKNKYGEDGIRLHIYENNVHINNQETMNIEKYISNYYTNEDIYTKQSEGYYHVMYVPEIVVQNVEVIGVMRNDINGMLVSELQTSIQMENVLLHELGHHLGLMPGDYNNRHIQEGEKRVNGVDSYEYTCDEYPSVMNYNCLFEFKFDDGKHHNDWEFIAENLEKNNPN